MNILDFLKGWKASQSHPLLDPEGVIFLFVFRDKHKLLEELEFTCLFESVMEDRDALARQKGAVLSKTKYACQSARFHNGKVLADWLQSGNLSVGDAFSGSSFIQALQMGDFRDEKSAIQTLGFVPYVLAIGPISERYAAILAHKFSQKFAKYLSWMFFSSHITMKQVADSMGCGGMFELEL